MMSDAIKSIGVEATIYVNDRKILDGLSRSCGIDTNREFIKLVSIIDKIDKIGKVTVLRDVEKLIGENGRKQIDKFLSITGDSLSKLKQISEILDDKDTTMACEQLSNILTSLKNAGYSEKQITFDQTIARGLSYYTGTIFETKLIKCPEIGSICSGGRYDNLIKQLGGPDLPAIGTSIGVDRLMEGISLLGIGSKIKTKTKVYVVNLNSKLNSERFKIASILRENNIPTEMIYQDSRLKNQLRDIDKLGVSEVILFGENEQKNNTFIAKNLDKGTQQEVPLSNLIDYYKKVFK
jgi:histidyl-tRNA synthetase